MRLGLIADIHEHVEFLRVALHRFRHERVERIVVLGDVFETGERIEETCRLLAEAHAVGVWGNHVFGLGTGTASFILPTLLVWGRGQPALFYQRYLYGVF